MGFSVHELYKLTSYATAEPITMYHYPEEVIQIYCSLTSQTRKMLQTFVWELYKFTAHARAMPIILYHSLEKLYIITRFIVLNLYGITVITGGRPVIVYNSMEKGIYNYGSRRRHTCKSLRASVV